MNATHAVIGRCPWAFRVQIHGWRHGKLVFFVLLNMAHGFTHCCEIIPNRASKSLENSSERAIYIKERWLNGDKKSSWQLENALTTGKFHNSWSCVIATRESLFWKMFWPLFCFEQVKTSKKVLGKLKKQGLKKQRLGLLKKCLQSKQVKRSTSFPSLTN